VGDEGAVLDGEGWRKDCRAKGLLGALGIVSIDPGRRCDPVLSGDGGGRSSSNWRTGYARVMN